MAPVQRKERLQALAQEEMLLHIRGDKVGSSAWWERFAAVLCAMREARRRSAAVRGWLTQAMT
jgi:hypothetical protein